MKADPLQTALRLHQTGQLAAAEVGYRKLLRRDPLLADANYLLGLLLHQSGRHHEAIAPLQRAVAERAGRAEFHNSLGDAHRSLGHSALACAAFERALALRPAYADAQINLAMTLNAVGRKDHALVVLFDAVAGQPSHAGLRSVLAAMLSGAALQSASTSVRDVLLALCVDQTVSTQSIAGAVLGLLCHTADWQQLVLATDADRDPFAAVSEDDSHAVYAVMQDPLLLAILPRIVACDPAVERVLTHLRRWILLRAAPHEECLTPEPTVPHAFLCALAQQCFNGEYAFGLSGVERQSVVMMRRQLGAALNRPGATATMPEPSLALFALYGALSTLPDWEQAILRSANVWSVAFHPLVQTQCVDRHVEQVLAAQLPRFTTITDDVSHAVRTQYESNPYPRWITLQHPPVTTVGAFVHALRPEVPAARVNAMILVAGCGSGHQPLQMALTYSDARVLAFDLSTASLAYAARMAVRYGVTTVRFGQGDVLLLDGMDEQFAIVSCSGVLHHLRDPLEGWQRLVSVLAPDGVMKIGLYSTHARLAVDAARQFARDHEFLTDGDGIRACRQAILSLPDAHPARGVLAFSDFFSLSGCRDLVMHVQERTYTIPEIAQCLSALGLRFLRFQLPHEVQTQFAAEHPGQGAHADLAAWDVFETAHPDTFAAMYQFWCCRG